MEPLTRIEQIMKGPPSRTSLMLKQLIVLLTTQSHYRSQRGNKLEMGHWWNLAHFLWQLHIPIGINVDTEIASSTLKERYHIHGQEARYRGENVFPLTKAIADSQGSQYQTSFKVLFVTIPPTADSHSLGLEQKAAYSKAPVQSLLRLDVGEHLVWELLASL